MSRLSEAKAINILKAKALMAGGYHKDIARIVLACLEYDKKYNLDKASSYVPNHTPEKCLDTLGATIRREGVIIEDINSIKAGEHGRISCIRNSVIKFQGAEYSMLMVSGRVIRIVDNSILTKL